MQIIPVIDLLSGQVVRGIAGRRDEYRPIQSLLVADPSPVSVASALIARFGFNRCYVADLDAIAGAEPAWPIYAQLMELGLELWVDAGAGDPGRAGELAEFSTGSNRLSGIIIGLETAPPPDQLGALFDEVGSEQLVFSLDLKQGQPLAMSVGWGGRRPEQIADSAVQAGARRMIVLDLARVGVSGGLGSEPLCQSIRRRHPTIELTAGGGVRNMRDVHGLATAGCDGVLVASALHDGRITADELASLERTRSRTA